MINKFRLKEEILQALEYEGKPVYVSRLYQKFGLPFVSLQRRVRSTSRDVILELAKEGKILMLRSINSQKFSKKPRVMICLPDCKEIPERMRVVNHLYTGNFTRIHESMKSIWIDPHYEEPKEQSPRVYKPANPGFLKRLHYLFFPNS